MAPRENLEIGRKFGFAAPEYIGSKGQIGFARPQKTIRRADAGRAASDRSLRRSPVTINSFDAAL
jgi:hypothetical protein